MRVQLFLETETPNSYSVLVFRNLSIVQELRRAAKLFGRRSFVIPI